MLLRDAYPRAQLGSSCGSPYARPHMKQCLLRPNQMLHSQLQSLEPWLQGSSSGNAWSGCLGTPHMQSHANRRVRCASAPQDPKARAAAQAAQAAVQAALAQAAEQRIFARELMGPRWQNRARLSDDMLQQLMELPGTQGMADLRDRADDLSAWKIALGRGVLPKMDDVEWPQEPFKTKFADALRNLEMPRFTRRYPAVLNTLMKQMLQLVQEFEQKMAEAQQQQQQRQSQQQQQSASNSQNEQQQQQPQNGNQGQQGQEGEGGGDQDMQQQMEMSQQMMEQAMQEALEKGNQEKEGQRQLQVQLEDLQNGKMEQQDLDPDLAKGLEDIAKDIVKNFEQQMEQVMENLESAEGAFEDLSTLLSGAEGFDLSQGTWRRTGWRELDKLRKVLEDCTELRELVRQLGRGGGKGPLRRAPEELEAAGFPPGVIRSPLQPEEVRGLTRSGDLSRMLPSEMALLAHGWPRKGKRSLSSVDTEDSGAETQSRKSPVAVADGELSVSSGEFDLEEYYLPGARAARMLHRARRAERMLLSYERTGWLEDQPARVTKRMEYRPAAEMGPIIVCLDTSGSMQGARETVAKALALECLRGANRQKRACYLYAFSGPRQVQELELKVDFKSLDPLLEFLSCSFSGGTDVDAPLKLSLERLGKQEWAQADILMVTDGEIPMVDDSIRATIQKMNKDMGLEVHGLLVSSHVSEAMKQLCTNIHVFKSWTSVGGRPGMY